MLKKLRRKFIFTNMLLVVVVLAVVFATICVVNYNQRENDIFMALDHGSNVAMKQDNMPPAKIGDDSIDEMKSQLPEGRRNAGNDQFVAVSSYVIDVDGGMLTTMDDSLGLDDATRSDAVVQALDAFEKAGNVRTSGRIAALNLYYLIVPTADGSLKMTVASSNYIDSNMASLAGTLAVVCMAALLAFFVISYFLARWALRPVEYAWQQQQRFVADASHELKTPLTVIMANDSILLSQPQSTIEQQRQWIESTETEAHLMQGLVNDMLFLAQAQSNDNGAVQATPVDISDIVQGVVLQFESVAFEKEVQIDERITLGLTVHAESARLQRLVATLMDNACKYVEPGGTVRVELTREGPRCRLDVANTGTHIGADDLPFVFDRFYRSDKARTRSVGGFGLGLSIAKGIVDQCKGTISVQSSEGEGTVFTVCLPLVQA